MTKTKPQVKIVNCETGEEVIRDANADEIAQMELDAAAYLAAKAEAETKAAARQAILNRLGLSQEEANILLGGK